MGVALILLWGWRKTPSPVHPGGSSAVVGYAASSAGASGVPDSSFLKIYGVDSLDEEGTLLIPSEDGNLYLGGTRSDELLLMKLDPQGGLLWERTFGITTLRDVITDLRLDSEGFLIGSGYGRAPNQEVFQGFAFRYDPRNDVLLWLQLFPVGNRLFSILEPTLGGAFLVAGDRQTATMPDILDDAFWLELDRNTGTPTANVATLYTFGSREAFYATVQQGNDLFVAGRYTEGNFSSRVRASLSRFDLQGNEQWSRLFHIPLAGVANLQARALLFENDALLVAADGNDNDIDVNATELFLHKFDLDGNLLWSRKLDLTAFANETVLEIISLPDGFLLFGENLIAPQDFFLLKTDKDGHPLWAKSYGTPGVEFGRLFSQSQLLRMGDFLYFTGRSDGFSTNNDIVLFKTDLEGRIADDCVEVRDETVLELMHTPAVDSVSLTPAPYPDALTPFTPPSRLVFLYEQTQCSIPVAEQCGNGCDDDLDGLFDAFDPDCACSPELLCGTFVRLCPEPCEYEPRPDDFDLEELWRLQDVSTGDVLPIVGDVDGDCFPDICQVRVDLLTLDSRLGVYDGRTGALKAVGPTTVYNFAQPALADVDGDGMAELFAMQGGGNPRLTRFDWVAGNLVETWESSTQVRAYTTDAGLGFAPALADFNQDGRPEVYIGNQIFDSQTGLELANGGTNNQGITEVGTFIQLSSVVVAADVLAPPECLPCRGLELVAGNQVYAVQINSYTNPALNYMEVVREAQGRQDGATAIADFDLDGDLDGIVTTVDATASGVEVYVWDLQTDQLIGAPYLTIPGAASRRSSLPAVGDVDGDGRPEIVLSTAAGLHVLEDYQDGGGVMWGVSGTTLRATRGFSMPPWRQVPALFDLEGDGALEIIFHERLGFHVFDGDLNVRSSRFVPGASLETPPVIADLNLDGSTEVVLSASQDLVVLRSANRPFLRARPIWNQLAYQPLSIEDDGTVPAHRQPILLPEGGRFNHFLAQEYLFNDDGTPHLPVPDAVVSVPGVVCDSGEFVLTLEVCNQGVDTLRRRVPLSIYRGSPITSAAPVVLTDTLPQDVAPDSCLLFELRMPAEPNVNFFVVVNDSATIPTPFFPPNDLPNTRFGECDFSNNTAGFRLDFTPPTLELGPDTLLCAGGSRLLQAPAGFVHYLWQDSSTAPTLTADAPGLYWVEVEDACGGQQRDSLLLTLDPASVVNLGPDTAICQGGSLSLSVPGFDQYLWTPATTLDCDTCAVVTLTPSDSTTYVLTARIGSECISSDTLTLTLLPPRQTFDTLLLCQGDTVVVFGQPVTTFGTFEQTFSAFDGCDSIHAVIVLEASDTTFTFDTLQICQGDSALVFGQFQHLPGDFVRWDSSTQCILVETLTLEVGDTLATQEQRSICQGDTVLVFGQPVTTAGAYRAVFQGANGCDSAHTVLVEVLDTVETFESRSICAGETTDIFGTPVGQAGVYSMTFSGANACDSTHTILLEVRDTFRTQESRTICSGDSILIFGNFETQAGTYSQTFSAGNGCDSTHVVVLEVLPPLELTFEVKASCTPQGDGAVTALVNGGLPPYTYQWEPVGGAGPTLDNLPPGDYSVTVTDAFGCTIAGTTKVVNASNVSVQLEVGDATCFGAADGQVTVLDGLPEWQYSLDNATYQPSGAFGGLAAGDYTLFILDENGCVSTQEFQIGQPAELVLELPKRLRVQLGDSMQIVPSLVLRPGLLFEWTPAEGLSCTACPEPFARPLTSGWYVLTLTEGSCSVRDSVFLEVVNERRVFVPNVFSPDGDGINDRLTLFGGGDVVRIRRFQVFDRWGGQLFEASNFPPNDPNLGWDGTYQGRELDPAVFVWFAEIEFLDGQVELFKGDVVLLR